MAPWLVGLFSWFTSPSGSSTVEKATDIVDEAFHTEQEVAVENADDLKEARAFAPGEKWDSWIDRAHRMVRPTVAFWAVGILFGVVPAPIHWANIPGEVWAVILLVMTFYFGGRGFLQDIRAKFGK